jgi:glycosyltransferase involved in cell wall biosynthesis
VVFTGNVVSHLPYFAQFDAFLLTSREDPFPLVVLDAASLGKPVVCFAEAGGAPELVQEDAGLVVPYLDVEAMAAAATAIVEDADLRARLGRRAREKVLERHDMGVGGAHIAEIVRRQLARNPRSLA